MNRITEKFLQAVCDRINRATNSPMEAYVFYPATETSPSGYKAQIGCYHLSHAYGGVSLHRMHNEGGGVEDVFGCGHVPKRELSERMFAFLKGLEAAEQKAA